MLEYYGDVIAMRHYQQGAPGGCQMGVGAGDQLWRRLGEHPTQVLTDLYTIRKAKGTLRRAEGAEAFLISPEEMSLLDEFKSELDERSVVYRQAESVDKCIADADVIYMEPVVQADYTKAREEFTRDQG